MEKQSNGSWVLSTRLDHDYLHQGHTLSDVRPSFVPLPGSKPDSISSSALHAMDKDGDGVLDRSEWMKMMD